VLEDFMDEFDALLIKYSIDYIILTNRDDDTMGKYQLAKIIESEEGEEERVLVMVYSGNGDILCECCKEREWND
jgi:hypothetical protein